MFYTHKMYLTVLQHTLNLFHSTKSSRGEFNLHLKGWVFNDTSAEMGPQVEFGLLNLP